MHSDVIIDADSKDNLETCILLPQPLRAEALRIRLIYRALMLREVFELYAAIVFVTFYGIPPAQW